MGIVDRLAAPVMGAMTTGEKVEVMIRVMDRFLSGVSAEDKRKVMAETMPRLLEGINVFDLMAGLARTGGTPAPDSPGLDVVGLPLFLGLIVPSIPRAEREAFILQMVEALARQGASGLDEDGRSRLGERMIDAIRRFLG